MAFLRTQTADQPRIPWRWSTTGKKDSTPYKPTAVGKWWYDYWIDSQNDPGMEFSAASHVRRIMETELGLQLLGDKRCSRCRAEGMECWIYSERGRKQGRRHRVLIVVRWVQSLKGVVLQRGVKVRGLIIDNVSRIGAREGRYYRCNRTVRLLRMNNSLVSYKGMQGRDGTYTEYVG